MEIYDVIYVSCLLKLLLGQSPSSLWRSLSFQFLCRVLRVVSQCSTHLALEHGQAWSDSGIPDCPFPDGTDSTLFSLHCWPQVDASVYYSRVTGPTWKLSLSLSFSLCVSFLLCSVRLCSSTPHCCRNDALSNGSSTSLSFSCPLCRKVKAERLVCGLLCQQSVREGVTLKEGVGTKTRKTERNTVEILQMI